MMKPVDKNMSIAAINRRSFLAGAGILAGSAPFSLLSGTNSTMTANWSTPQQAVFNEMSYINFEGTGKQHHVPRISGANKKTRDYVESISHEEYLRRHWFI